MISLHENEPSSDAHQLHDAPIHLAPTSPWFGDCVFIGMSITANFSRTRSSTLAERVYGKRLKATFAYICYGDATKKSTPSPKAAELKERLSQPEKAA
jgi:hypothetical protein